MANQEIERKDVGYCFKNVKKLIDELPEEIFSSDPDLAKKKKWADAGLVELEKFFLKLKGIKKDELDEFYGIKDRCKGLFDMVCPKALPTVDIEQP
jgi:hypothetical protein